MREDLLRRLNFLICLGLAVLAAVVQSTVFRYAPFLYVQPDLMLILSVYFGFRRGMVEGAVLVMIGSFIQEAHSGAGTYYLMATNVYCYLIAKLLSRTVVVPDMLSTIGFVAGLTLLKKIGILILLGMAGKAGNGIRHFLVFLVPGLFIQALLTPFCFSWFHRIDVRTHKLEDEHLVVSGAR